MNSEILQNIPAFKFSFFFIIGILIGSSLVFNPLLLIILSGILTTYILLLQKKNGSLLFRLILIALLIMIFGIYNSNIDFFYHADNSIRFVSDTKRKSKVELIGIITELPDYDTTRIKFVLESNKVISGSDTLDVSGEVIADVRKDNFIKVKTHQPSLTVGDKILLSGQLTLAGTSRNPGEFDYKKYLELHNIYKTFFVSGYENAKVISNNNLNFLYQNILFPAKIFALNNIDKYNHGDEGAFLKGLVTGERSDISTELKDAFVNAGVMHLIAVSGLNVAYIIISATLLLSLFRVPQVPKTIITIIILLFYCLFTGNSSSILRASIMGILVMTAFLLERRINFYNIIGIAVMIILIYDSKQLFDPSFILSFSATISMAIFLSVFEKLFINRIRENIIKGKKMIVNIAGLFFTSLAAQIGTLPITAIYFGKISIISLFANIIAVPLSNFSLAIGFFQILCATFSEFISSLIAETNNLLLTVQILFIKWCASLDFAYIQVVNFNTIKILSYYAMIILILTIKNKSKIIFRITLCILVLTGTIIYNTDFSRKLKITFLDIGQGDCALIETPDGKNILIDCGRINNTFNSGERTIGPYLRRNGINKIDLLIITHLHLDHIGGINYLLQNFKVAEILESGQKVRSLFTNTMDSLIFSNKIKCENIRKGDLIDELNNLRLYFLFPTDEFVSPAGITLGNNLNNGSLAFILKYKDVKIFFSGDIEWEAEKYVCDCYSGFLKTNILKVAHHGSITSSTIQFIVNNLPEYAVISCGLFNKFNHPSDIVLNRLSNIGAKIYRTDTGGAVILESDGTSVDVLDWK